MPLLPDFVSLNQAQSELSASLPADVSALSQVIAAASNAIRRFTGRDISLAIYDECYSARGYSAILTRQYPVVRIQRLATNPLTVLSVVNGDPTTNQRAGAELTATGDVEAGFVPVGLGLTRMASGVQFNDGVFFGQPTSVGFYGMPGGSGGALTTGVYQCSYSLINGASESIRSADVSVTVATGQVISFAFPPIPSNGVGFNLYVSTVGGGTGTETKQNASPITTPPYTLSALISGTAPATAANLTAQALASSVNSIGGGWQATVASDYEKWASSDLRAPQGTQAAMAAQSGSGACFQVHSSDLSGWTLDERTGQIRLNNQTWDPVFALMNFGTGPLVNTFPPGFQNIRCIYQAGYATVPADVQMACLITAKAMLYELQTVRIYESETLKDWTGKLANWRSLPKEATDLLMAGGWRSYRRN